MGDFEVEWKTLLISDIVSGFAGRKLKIPYGLHYGAVRNICTDLVHKFLLNVYV